MACAAGVFALRRVLIAMKLKHSQRQMVAGCYDICIFFIDEEQDGSHKRRDVPWALFIHHEPDGIDTGVNGGVDVLFARQTTDLDAGAGRQGACRSPDGNWGAGPRLRARHRVRSGMGCHGSQSYAGVRSGSPQWVS